MRTRISRYTAEVLRIRLLRALEVAHAIEVRVFTLNSRNVNSMFAASGRFFHYFQVVLAVGACVCLW